MGILVQFIRSVRILWGTGNMWIRRVIVFLLCWPAAMIIVSLFGSYTASIITALLPLVALIALALIWPLIIVIPISLPWPESVPKNTKAALQWVATILGLELGAGIYFTLVPVHNKPMLLGLLILAFATFLALSIGKKVPGSGLIKTAAVIIIIVVTIMFFAADKKWQGKPGPAAPTATQEPAAQQPKQAEWVKDQESGLMVKQTSHEVVPKAAAKIKQSVEDNRGLFTTDCKNSPLNLGIDVAPGEEVEVRHVVESVAKMNRCSYDMRGNAHPVAEAASMIVMDRWRDSMFFPDMPPYSYVLSLGKPGESQIAKIFESDGEHITLQNNTTKTLPLYFTFNYINKKDWMRQVGWDGSSISFEAVKL